MAGNRLGPRARIIYESDEVGQVYILQIDASFIVAGAGAGGSTPDIFDPTDPPAGVMICPPPRRFKPRIVYAQSANGDAVKEIVIASATGSLYATTLRKVVAIDGENFTTTGRRGEKISF